MVLRKDELEIQLKDEHQLIKAGVLKDDSPLDTSEEFRNLCDACRRGDLRQCQEMIATGVNINARDMFDYTPLILASLCGHYEVVQLLLESGALCERDTFQGERCLYNALTNRIRNLLLQYDYSKSTDPLQPLASHVTSLLIKQMPRTSDITLTASSHSFHLHKFILSARSPYFAKKLAAAPETASWRLASTIPPEAFSVAIRYLYLGDVPTDLGIGPMSQVTEEDVFKGIDKVSKQLEVESLWEGILAGSDRRLARQRHQDEVARGRDQLEKWFKDNVIRHKVEVDPARAREVKWSRTNGIFADVLLRADYEGDYYEELHDGSDKQTNQAGLDHAGIPIGPVSRGGEPAPPTKPRCSVLYPVHRAMLIRSDYFLTMFSSSFKEAQDTDFLQIVGVDCTPPVLEVVLAFLYCESADIPLGLALDVLLAADMLFIEKLKAKAALVISTLGNGNSNALQDRTHGTAPQEDDDDKVEQVDIYDVLRAGWMTRVQRLEEFAARYIAYRLEEYIDEEEFEELVRESAARIQARQETDTIELIDDIRYYLSERFRLRFEDSGLEEMMDEAEEVSMPTDEGIDMSSGSPKREETPLGAEGVIRTLDGEVAGDEFASDAINYQVLLGKIDGLLERLRLDA